MTQAGEAHLHEAVAEDIVTSEGKVKCLHEYHDGNETQLNVDDIKLMETVLESSILKDNVTEEVLLRSFRIKE